MGERVFFDESTKPSEKSLKTALGGFTTISRILWIFQTSFLWTGISLKEVDGC